MTRIIMTPEHSGTLGDPTASFLKSSLETLDKGPRQTGRTSRLVAVMEEGDYLILPMEAQADIWNKKFKEMNRSGLTCIAVSPHQSTENAKKQLPSDGRCFIDHDWMYLHYHYLLDHLFD